MMNKLIYSIVVASLVGNVSCGYAVKRQTNIEEESSQSTASNSGQHGITLEDNNNNNNNKKVKRKIKIEEESSQSTSSYSGQVNLTEEQEDFFGLYGSPKLTQLSVKDMPGMQTLYGDKEQKIEKK